MLEFLFGFAVAKLLSPSRKLTKKEKKELRKIFNGTSVSLSPSGSVSPSTYL